MLCGRPLNVSLISSSKIWISILVERLEVVVDLINFYNRTLPSTFHKILGKHEEKKGSSKACLLSHMNLTSTESHFVYQCAEVHRNFGTRTIPNHNIQWLSLIARKITDTIDWSNQLLGNVGNTKPSCWREFVGNLNESCNVWMQISWKMLKIL